jgi:NAD(P)-dependent dehydrogenase (short-subunit alcohol dehydrogenase family)
MRMGILNGKTAIITGGASGIGFAIARRFYEEGANVVPCDLRRDKLDKAFVDLTRQGQRVHTMPADVTMEDDIKRVVKEAVARFGSINILVNCAGALTYGKLEEADPRLWDRVIRTNAYAPWRFMVAVLPEMRKAGGGSIVNISSINGIKAFPGQGIYCTSKAALQMLSQVMAMEVAPDNIRVNLILPGLVEDTDFLSPVIGEGNVPSFYDSLRAIHPLGRNAKPDDVADAALFLASEQSRYITGVLLNVDGGRHMATNRPLQK